ncbi:MAG: hypothetical protein KDE55_14855 [Novosphingobium sp.]|nr:hypothetical protein [Novosphingobium sp.]
MIEADAADALESLSSQLKARAAAIASAHREEIALRRRNDPNRWRRADILWPSFTKG